MFKLIALLITSQLIAIYLPNVAGINQRSGLTSDNNDSIFVRKIKPDEEVAETNNQPSHQYTAENRHDYLDKDPGSDSHFAESAQVDNFPQSRRYPQYPQSGDAGSQFLSRQPQVISVISGNASPHQSVSWNPPPTIVPPSINSRNFQSSLQIQPQRSHVASSSDLNDDRASRFFNPSLQENRYLDNSRQFLPPSPQLPQSISNGFQRNNPEPTNERKPDPQQQPPPQPQQPHTTNSQGQPVKVVAKPQSGDSSQPGSPNKDDVVIYYYYYYDDEKNGTDAKKKDQSDEANLDTIPSLEQFDSHGNANKNDQSRASKEEHTSASGSVQGGNTHFRNSGGSLREQFERTRQTSPPTSPATAAPIVTSYSNFPHITSPQPSFSNSFQNRPPQHFRDSFRVNPVTPSPPPKSSTDVSVSVSVSGDNNPFSSQGAPVSNVFRYGSSVGVRPNFDPFRNSQFGGPGSRGTAFQPQFPGQAFRHIPTSSTASPINPSVSSTRDSQPNFPPQAFTPSGESFRRFNQPHDFGRVEHVEHQPPRIQHEFTQSIPTTTSTTSTTTTTTTTTTTEAPTTTTTEEPTTVPSTEAPSRSRFGNRRNRFGSGNRLNVLNRPRIVPSTASEPSSSLTSSSTTTTTTTQRPRQRFGSSLRRPGARPNLRAGNQNRRQPPAEEVKENENLNDQNGPTQTTQSFQPSSSTSTTTSAPRRFGGSGYRRNNGNANSRSSIRSSTTTTTSTAAPVRPTRRTVIPSGTRREGRVRPRLPYLRGRNRAKEDEAEPSSSANPSSEVSSDLVTESTPAENNLPSNSETSESNSGDNENDSGNSASSESPDSVTPSSTERTTVNRSRPRNPLFGNRPRPSLFGSRRNPTANS